MDQKTHGIYAILSFRKGHTWVCSVCEDALSNGDKFLSLQVAASSIYQEQSPWRETMAPSWPH